MQRFSSWSIATTVRAPAHQVNAFLSHHVRAGAEKIYLFFDDPRAVSFDEQLAPDVVQAFVCDEGYWRNMPDIPPYSGHSRARPDNIETRQSMNMLLARAIMPSEWLLHIDVDELVYVRRPLSDVLSDMPENVFSVLLKPLEAVYTAVGTEGSEFETQFFKRFSYDESCLSRIYPPNVLALCFGGMLGHVVGKTLVRKRPPIARMSVHQPVPADGGLACNVETPHADLLHFEGQSFDLFRQKSLARRRRTFYQYLTPRARARADYLAAAVEANDLDALLQAYKALYVMGPERLQEAMDAGIVVRIDWRSPPAGDALLPMHNPVNERSPRPSTWQGRVLRTPKGHYLVVKGKQRELRVEKVNSIIREGSSSSLIEVAEVGDRVVLFARTPSGQLFVSLDRRSRVAMTTSPSAATHFLLEGMGDGDSEWVALRHEHCYLSASPDGSTSWAAERAGARERFLRRHILPQL